MSKIIKYIIIGICITSVLFFFLKRFFATDITLFIALAIAVAVSIILYKKKQLNFTFNQTLLVFSFVSILFIPFFGEKQNESLENRSLEQFPEWRWSNVWKFFRDYQNYFNDRFTLKNELVAFYGELKYDRLKLNNLTSQVVFGKEGWMFFNEKKALDNISIEFTLQELKRINYNLTLITIWFEEHGIKYYLTFPPSKPRVHNEKAPDFLNERLTYSSSDQLFEYLKLNSRYNFINYVDELRKAKKDNPVYLKYDTHWNERGAYIGYKKILDVLNKDFPKLNPYELSDFNIKKQTMQTGDLLHLLGYKTQYAYLEDAFTPKDGNLPKLIYTTRFPDNPDNVFQVFEMQNDTSGINIYVIRDSYSENLKKFLSLNFNKSVYDWTPRISIPRILEYKPNIILHEILERFNYEYFNLPPEIENDTAFVNRFNFEDF